MPYLGGFGMKRIKLIRLLIIIALAISLVLTGCGKKDKSQDTAVNVENVDKEEEKGKADEKDVMDSETKEEPPVIEEQKEAEEDNKEEPTSNDVQASDKSPDEQKNTKDTKEEDVNTEETESFESIKEEVQQEGYILKIQGKVEKELKLSLKDLKAMEDIIFQDDFFSINNFGTKAYTNFKGVNLWKLLEKAEISSDAGKVSIIATDGYTMEFSIEQVQRQDYIDETNPDKKFPMIIAWEENGVGYDPNDGPPFKLVVAQKEPGDVNKPQWVSNIDRIVVE